MPAPLSSRPTLGFLSTWSVYQGATIDSYTHTLFQGICAAAREHDCNLLLGCGISLPNSPRASRTAWAVSDARVDFVPVGPWNCDGLIVIPDDLSDAQYAYIQGLLCSGFPIIFTTSERPGPLVAVDNASGIRHAFEHLLQHGHRRIAFIAGKSGHGGDSAERLAAYRQAAREAGIPEDPRLIAFGEHRREDGRLAMQQILDAGASFTALLASNDLSCLGAIDVLRAAGRRIPDEVAVIGFDDILEARSHLPALTTVRIPTFTLGHSAVTALLEMRNGKKRDTIRVPPQFVIRQSCGCRPASTPLTLAHAHPPPVQLDATQAPSPSRADTPSLETVKIDLAQAMAEATFVETRHSTRDEIETLSLDLVGAFAASLSQNDPTRFDVALQRLFDWLEGHAEDAYPWQGALSNLRDGSSGLRSFLPDSNSAFADALLDRARLEIGEQGQRQANYALLQHMEMTNHLGLMTSELLTALDASESANILAQHLPQLGVDHALVAIYVPRDSEPSPTDDSLGRCSVLLTAGLPTKVNGYQFAARSFPPPGLYPADSAFQLALLPLTVDDRTTGFIAFSAANLEPLAAIAFNVASSLRASRLYLDAIQGRRLAEEANRLKTRFLSTVSHELRTPLSLIVGLSDLVLRGERDKTALSEATVRDLTQIHINAQHLGRLVSDVLDLASREAGQLRLLRTPLEVGEVLREAATIGEEMAREKGLTWRGRVPERGPQVLGDRMRLRQVVLNLISNAVKFTPAGEIALDVETNGREVKVQVSDTGIGIPDAEQTKIFDEFHRTERAIQSGYGGMGLGLTISKYLVEQHGGTIGVRSPGELGRGATFFFTLPLLDAAQRTDGRVPLPELEHSAQTDAPRKVLVVDDEPGILALYCRLLEQAGHLALQARSGHEALQIIETARPDLVLLDLMMPQMDGFAVLDELRARETTRDIPVIVLTARPLDEAEIERLNRGVAAIMGKGLFNANETLQRIEAALEHQRGSGNPTQRLVRHAMGYIHAHYTERLTRERIASHVNINPDYLTDCFRQEAGVTPIAYLNRYRIWQARELLENSDSKITQIALAVGFSEGAHFTRTFQREVGVTPSAYRRGKRA